MRKFSESSKLRWLSIKDSPPCHISVFSHSTNVYSERIIKQNVINIEFSDFIFLKTEGNSKSQNEANRLLAQPCLWTFRTNPGHLDQLRCFATSTVSGFTTVCMACQNTALVTTSYLCTNLHHSQFPIYTTAYQLILFEWQNQLVLHASLHFCVHSRRRCIQQKLL